MKKLNLNHYLILITLLFLASSCATTNITFKEVYTTELSGKQNSKAFFSEDHQRFLGVEDSKVLGSVSDRKFTLLDMESGKILYSKSAKEFGEVKAVPAYQFNHDQGVIIFISEGLTNRSINAFDIETQEELWSISRSDEKYNTIQGIDFNWMGGFALEIDGKFRMHDARTGEIIWEYDNNKFDVLNTIASGNKNFILIEEEQRILLSNNKRLASFDLKEGEISWVLEGEFGNFQESDILFDKNKGLFFGPQGASTAKKIGEDMMQNSTGLSRLAGRAIVASESGIQDNPLYYIDLENGELLWETTFKSSGQTYPIYYEDIIILSDLMTYALNEKTGEVLWQSVSEERLEDEENRRLISEFTPFKLDASNRTANDNIIVDDNIFVVHSTIFDEGGDKQAVSFKRLNIRTGEEIWVSKPERITVSNFFFQNGKLFVQTSNRKLFENGELRALDAGSGSLLYEIENRASVIGSYITDYHVHLKDIGMTLTSYDINTGENVNLKTPMPLTYSLEPAGDKLFGRFGSAFGSNTMVAFVNAKTFEVERKVEVPFNPSKKMVKGDYLFLYNDSDAYKSLLAVDFDNAKTRGYFKIDGSGKFQTTTNGQSNPTMPDVHYYVTEDGKNIYLAEGTSFKKLTLAD
jgi:outer membrane protein assembly factor BamB